MGADHTNIAVYVTNIKELLRYNSEEEYKEKKTVLTSKWSKPIVSYFQKMEKDILKHCGKWHLLIQFLDLSQTEHICYLTWEKLMTQSRKILHALFLSSFHV
jgi:hypothetical protein